MQSIKDTSDMITSTHRILPGQWVVRRSFNQVGKVADVYGDGTLIDVVLYAHDGSRIGRESPPCGGPRGFEPACPAENWIAIKKPDFPIPRYCSWEGRVVPLEQSSCTQEQS